MNSFTLLNAIGKTDDRFISEAKEKNKSKKNLIIFLSAAAACIALFFFIPNIPNFFGMGAQESDIFRNGYLIEDISLSTLSENFKGKLLLENIVDNGKLEFYSKTESFSEDQNDWYSLLYSEYNENDKIIMHCMFGEEKENWKVDMVFTDEATKTVNINGVDVEIAKFDLNLNYAYTYYAIFTYDNTVYDIRVSSNNENRITEILFELIK